MKILVLVLIFTIGFSAQANTRGFCSISKAGQLDNTHKQGCQNGFGIMYKGYLIPAFGCNRDVEQVVKDLESIGSCNKERSLGNCKVSYPKEVDYSNRNYCSTGFGVMYDGYLIPREGCYSHIDAAFDAMERICRD